MALLFRVLTILILLVFVFPRPILGLAKSSYAWSRDVSQLKAAILFKNNTRTTCEVALVTAKAGMVSANCLDFDNTGKLDTSTAYKVYIYDGPGTSTPIISTLDIADIHVHPSYNQDSLVYNIAVIQFNKDTADNFEQLLVSSYTVPEKSTFVLRSFNTIENKWNNFTSTTMPEENSDCDNYSGIYATNDAALLCTSATAPAAYKSTCDLPYGSLYMKDGDYVGIVALYSHSVILGEDVCTSDGTPQWRSYYTRLSMLHGFYSSIVHQPMNVLFDGKVNVYYSEIDNLFITDPLAFVDMKGKVQVGGDFFSRLDAIETIIESSPTPSTSNSHSSASNTPGSSKTKPSSHSAATTDTTESISQSNQHKINISVSSLIPLLAMLFAQTIF